VCCIHKCENLCTYVCWLLVEVNPFTLPSDEEVFRMRDELKKKKEFEREQNAKLKIHEKITNSSKRGNIRRFNVEDLVMYCMLDYIQ